MNAAEVELETSKEDNQKKGEDIIQQCVALENFLLFSKTYCPSCYQLKSLLSSLGVKVKVIELDQVPDGLLIQAGLKRLTGNRFVPKLFLDGRFYSGDEFTQLYSDGHLIPLLRHLEIPIIT